MLFSEVSEWQEGNGEQLTERELVSYRKSQKRRDMDEMKPASVDAHAHEGVGLRLHLSSWLSRLDSSL